MSKICDRCFATIRFVRLDTGKPIPVDPIPTADDKGNVAAHLEGKTLVGFVISREKPLQAGYRTYRPHFASCKPDKPLVLGKDRTPGLFEP
jgi:hypothetical protein